MRQGQRMMVFQLHVDSAECYWAGLALVAAVSYEAAVSEYVRAGESGMFVKSGEIILTEGSKTPVDGLSWSGGTSIITDNIIFLE